MTINLDGQIIDYKLKVSSRKTLGLEIKHGGELVITAPRGATLPMIEKVLIKKKSWILKKLVQSYAKPRFQPLRKFISGENIVLLGEEYIFDIVAADKNTLTVVDKTVQMTVKNQTAAQVLVSHWVSQVFEAKVDELIKKCLNHFNKTLDVDFAPTFKIRKMFKRWGSCSIDGRIHLSHSLFTARPEWIEYVIYHELSHLVHHDHSVRFYNVLSKVCADHRKLKKELQDNVVIYMGS